MSLLYKVKLILTIWPRNSTPDIYSRDLKMYSCIKTCTRMLTAVLLTINKNWEQPKCPIVGEWVNKLWSIPTIKWCTAIKMKELQIHSIIWVNLKGIMMKPDSTSPLLYESIYMMFLQRQIDGVREQGSDCQGLGWGRFDYKGAAWGNLGVMELFSTLIVVVVIQNYIGVKTHRTVHQKNKIQFYCI